MTKTLQLPNELLVDAESLEQLGMQLAQQIGPGDVLALVGPLGAGKTTLTRGLARGLQLDAGAVASPTFALAHTYRGGDITLLHLDLYRIANPAEAEAAGIEDLLYDAEAVVVVEWPERALPLIPDSATWLQIDVVAGGRRVEQVLPPKTPPKIL
jgi:tRNA threonylcarbamoyladenosine biosynthesis protein TsaE